MISLLLSTPVPFEIPSIGITPGELSGILEAIVSLVPVFLPTVVGLVGLRKGISFLVGAIRGA